MSRGEELFGVIYERGAVVFRQGEPGDTMYIIQSGAVEVSQFQDGREVVLGLLERGDFFGEMALLDDRPRSATVTAIRRTRLLPLTRTSLLKRVRQDPGVALHLVKAISHRIDQRDRLLRTMIEGDESLRSALEGSHDLWDEGTPSAPGEPKPPPALERGPTAEKYLRQVAKACLPRQDCVWFEAGETIFRQGEPGQTMYIIAEGSVEISQESEGGKWVLACLGPNDFFGEMALITGRPRTANAQATRHCRLLSIRRDEFFDRVKVEPELALYILQVMVRRLRQMPAAMAALEEAPEVVRRSLAPLLKKEGLISMALVSLSTCSGCSAVLLDEQDKLAELLQRARICYCPLLMDQGEIGETELAVVDGAVRVKEDEEKLKETRLKSRYLVAWGTCATLGGIPAMANQFELEELIEESYGHTEDVFAHYLSGVRGVGRTAYRDEGPTLLRRAGKLDDFVRVDYYLPGCPPQVSLLSCLVKELKGEPQHLEHRQIVCQECSRKPLKSSVERFWVFPRPEWGSSHCFSSRGALCLGFLTRGGCGAPCPRGGLPCWGCRGPSGMA